jgi:hypothetical protein
MDAPVHVLLVRLAKNFVSNEVFTDTSRCTSFNEVKTETRESYTTKIKQNQILKFTIFTWINKQILCEIGVFFAVVYEMS